MRTSSPAISRPVNYVRIKRFAELTGYTEKAVYRKIEDGVWIEGREYRRAPDGNICVNLEGYENWVEGKMALASRGKSFPVTAHFDFSSGR